MASDPSSATTSPVQRVLVIGLDMGDSRLIRRWSREGRLPSLAALLADGTWLDLETPAELLHTSTWPTFATGHLPGVHGVYYPYQPRPGFQQAQHIAPDQYHVPTFWAAADRVGRRCLAYDVPETFPEEGFRGRALFEWGTFAWYGERASQPPDLLDEMRSRFGQYPLKLEAKRLGLKVPESRMLERRLIASIDHKQASLQWLLDEQPWDLAVAAFCETHPAGHYLWPPGATDAGEGDFGALLRVYRALDDAIGKLREQLPADAALLVVSGDGLRANHCGWHLLPDVLERLGHLARPSDNGGSGGRPAGLLGRVKAAVPPGLRRRIADNLPWWLRDKIGASIQAAQVDWSRTRAFTLPTDLEGYIRVNLKGREPHGIVEPGAEYDALCRELVAQLEELTLPPDGRPAVKRVCVRNEVFPGPAAEHLPDLMVVWNDAAPITALASPRFGTVEGVSQDRRTGTHSTEAFLLATGPGIPRGVEYTGRLVDVAPTVLRLLGIDHHEAATGGRTLDVLLGAHRAAAGNGENAARNEGR